MELECIFPMKPVGEKWYVMPSGGSEGNCLGIWMEVAGCRVIVVV